MEIRAATPADARAVSLLIGELGYTAGAAATEERLIALRSSGADLVCVVELDGVVCGWIHGHRSTSLESGTRVEILGLVTAGAHRRKGLAAALVESVEQWATRSGIEVVVVRSNATRTESHHFYPAIGYRVSKTQHVYQKHLSNAPS